MTPVRIRVHPADVTDLQRALGYALSIWTRALTTGRSPRWELYALTGHAMRNTLAWMGAGDGERHVLWLDDASETLHAVARELESGPPSWAAFIPTVRRYADIAANAEGWRYAHRQNEVADEGASDLR